jgi:hypothetical protein
MMNGIAGSTIWVPMRKRGIVVVLVLALLCLLSGSGWTSEPEPRTWSGSYFDDMSAPEAALTLATILADGQVQTGLTELTTMYSASRWPSAALVAEIALKVASGVDADEIAGGKEVRLGKLYEYGFVPCPSTSLPPTYEAVSLGVDDESIAKRIKRHVGRFEWDEAISLGRSSIAGRQVHCELVIEWAKAEFERGCLSHNEIEWVWFELALRSLIELRRWGTDLEGGFATDVDLIFWMSDALLNAGSPELSFALAVVADDLFDEYELATGIELVQPSTSHAAIAQRKETLESMIHEGNRVGGLR